MNHSKETDPFEEFQFRPLTEGLGFHGKTPKPTPKPEVKATAPAVAEMASEPRSPSIQDLPTFKAPLPRKDSKKEVPAPKKSDELLQSLQQKPWDFKESEAKTARAQAEVARAAIANYDLSAMILDSMLLIAGFLTCLIVLLMVTKVDLIANLSSTDEGSALGASLAGLFLFLTWSYLVLSRTFLGATPGEWVFDQRMGVASDVGTLRYVGLTLLRSTIVIVTGLILMPILSLIMGRDVLGRWLGLELHKA